MNHNARFMSSISRSMSLSWTNNAQSPSLRRKVAQLEITPPSTFSSNIDHFYDEAASVGKLGAIIQTILWAMMQKKLYDPLAARRNLGKSIENSAKSLDEDLIMDTPQDQFNDGFEMLSDVDDVETRLTEQETEETLLSKSNFERRLNDDLLFVHPGEEPYNHAFYLTSALNEPDDMLLDQDVYLDSQGSLQRHNRSVFYAGRNDDRLMTLLSEARGSERRPDEILLGSDGSDNHQDLGRTLPCTFPRFSEDPDIMLNDDHSKTLVNDLVDTSRPQVQDFKMPLSGTLWGVDSPSNTTWKPNDNASQTNKQVESNQQSIGEYSERSFITQDSDVLL